MKAEKFVSKWSHIRLDFGKYEDKSHQWVYDNDKDYVSWILETAKAECYRPSKQTKTARVFLGLMGEPIPPVNTEKGLPGSDYNKKQMKIITDDRARHWKSQCQMNALKETGHLFE